jgi:hypothetical protein
MENFRKMSVNSKSGATKDENLVKITGLSMSTTLHTRIKFGNRFTRTNIATRSFSHIVLRT